VQRGRVQHPGGAALVEPGELREKGAQLLDDVLWPRDAESRARTEEEAVGAEFRVRCQKGFGLIDLL
jgi:hypothetical protein